MSGWVRLLSATTSLTVMAYTSRPTEVKHGPILVWRIRATLPKCAFTLRIRIWFMLLLWAMLTGQMQNEGFIVRKTVGRPGSRFSFAATMQELVTLRSIHATRASCTPVSGKLSACRIHSSVVVRAAAFSNRPTAAIPGAKSCVIQGCQRDCWGKSALPFLLLKRDVSGLLLKRKMGLYSARMMVVKHGSDSAKNVLYVRVPGTTSISLLIHRMPRHSGY